jgi:hypothetical protein
MHLMSRIVRNELQALLSAPALRPPIFDFSASDAPGGKGKGGVRGTTSGGEGLMTKLYRKCSFDVREEDIILVCASLSRARVTVMKTIGREFARRRRRRCRVNRKLHHACEKNCLRAC